jgi:RNA polymerase sigma-70 factor (ECF subfamily)
MNDHELIPHLFRTEYSKITAVLCKYLGFEQLEIAEDIASESFVRAMETWPYHGVPSNPTAWLYTVAKNKAKNHLGHDRTFIEKVIPKISHGPTSDPEIDLSSQNIFDSQLRMMFAVKNILT